MEREAGVDRRIGSSLVDVSFDAEFGRSARAGYA
jgi:hypothetical protein